MSEVGEGGGDLLSQAGREAGLPAGKPGLHFEVGRSAVTKGRDRGITDPERRDRRTGLSDGGAIGIYLP